MYSREFIRFLIDYQKPEYKENIYKEVRYFRFPLFQRILAAVFLPNRK
jgi:hypothetical protein